MKLYHLFYMKMPLCQENGVTRYPGDPMEGDIYVVAKTLETACVAFRRQAGWPRIQIRNAELSAEQVVVSKEEK